MLLFVIRILVLVYFTKFLPEQIHLNGEREVAISELLYRTLYQIVIEGILPS